MRARTRREALVGGATTATYLLYAGRASAVDARGEAGLDIGVQIFAFLDAALTDLPGTLRALWRIGYRRVEMLAGLAPMRAMRRALDDAGLVAPSLHASANRMFPGVPSMADDLDALIATCRTIGARHLVCSTPWIAGGVTSPADLVVKSARMSGEAWLAHSAFLNRTSRRVREAGMTLSYHNHRHDFAPVAGATGLDLIVRHTERDVGIELDCGWARAAGGDPVATIGRLGDRLRLLHLKDLQPPSGETVRWTPLGDGILPIAAILRAARAVGAEVAFVEMEPPFLRPPLIEAEVSLAYLRGIDETRIG